MGIISSEVSSRFAIAQARSLLTRTKLNSVKLSGVTKRQRNFVLFQPFNDLLAKTDVLASASPKEVRTPAAAYSPKKYPVMKRVTFELPSGSTLKIHNPSVSNGERTI